MIARASVWLGGWLAVVYMVVSATALAAQTQRATVTGVVTDETGAVVPDAEVTITNLSTNVSRSTMTDGEGRYQFPSLLDPGVYQLKVSREGFQTALTQQIELRIGDVRSVNVTLKVGSVAEEITVTAQAPLVETETSVRGDVIIGRQITELPLNGRNFTSFATLIPGVSRAVVGALTDASAFQGSVSGLSEGSTEAARFSRSLGSSISANGLRPQNNNWSIDGVDNNEPQYGQIGIFPPPDAIQEFKVETSVPQAEVGRAGGAVINANFKSGGNEIHGSVYYFGRNDVLDARPVFSRLQGGGPFRLPPKPPRREHEYGFTLSGPIIKNRVFYFGDYQGQRNKFPFERGSPFTSVPTMKTRMGDFSEFLGPGRDGRLGTDDDTGVVFDPNSGDPFPGNIIPRRLLDPVAVNYLSYFDPPNAPGVANNFLKFRRINEKIDQFDVRMDIAWSEKQTIFGRFSFNDQFRSRDSFFTRLPAGFGAGEETGATRQVAFGDTYTFSPSVINDFRFGFTRIEIGILECGIGGRCGVSPTVSKDIGIPNVNLGDKLTEGGMGIGTGGLGFIEFTGDGGPFLVPSNNTYFSDKVSVIKGAHSIKFGGEVRLRQIHPFDGGRTGPAKGFMGANDGGTGNAQAGLLLGVMNFSARPQVNGPFSLTSSEWGVFIQDDWKVSPDLTFNIGLRYDFFRPQVERFNRIGNYDLATGTVRVATSNDRDLVNSDKNNFGPRFGFAYAFGPNRKFALRGGYGLLYALDAAEFPPLTFNPPNVPPAFIGGTHPVTGRPITLSTGPPVFPGGSDPQNLDPTVAYRQIDPNRRDSYVHQYNLTVQWEFASNWVLDVGYVGTRGLKLQAVRNLGLNRGLGVALNRAGRFLNGVKAYENRAQSAYDSLQVRLEKRFSYGLGSITSYTWGHSIDNSTGDFGAIGEARGEFGGPVNPLNERLERGNSGFDYRHRFTSAVIYDLPFGSGRPFLNNLDAVTDRIIGGWQVNFIVLGQSGQPFTPTVADSSVRPDLVGDPRPTAADRAAGRSFNPSAFRPPSRSVRNFAGRSITFGTAGRNILRGPNRFNTDFSLFKNTRITEGINLQFGIEFFNLFNNVQLVLPNAGINFNSDGSVNFSNNVGQTFNAYPQRQGQFRLKLLF